MSAHRYRPEEAARNRSKWTRWSCEKGTYDLHHQRLSSRSKFNCFQSIFFRLHVLMPNVRRVGMWISAVEIDTNCLSINQFSFMFAAFFSPNRFHRRCSGHRNHCWPTCSISTMISVAIIAVIRYRTTQPTIARFIGRARMAALGRWVAADLVLSATASTKPFLIHASVHQLNMN